MPVTGFVVGKDASIDLISPAVGVLNFPLLTNFDARPDTRLLESVPITNNGRPVHRNVFHGWEGTFEVDRADGTVDALSQFLEDNYYAGAPETYWMITETIRNPDGSLDQFRYVNVVIIPETHGSFRAEEKVTQRFGFRASYRQKI